MCARKERTHRRMLSATRMIFTLEVDGEGGREGTGERTRAIRSASSGRGSDGVLVTRGVARRSVKDSVRRREEREEEG